ncbi:MAG TPA: HAD family phosphatase, partial [Pseudonocardia sp.]
MSDRDGLLAVLWDMDGTLVDSEKLWDVSLAELARRLGGELSEESRAAMVGG